MLDKKEFPYVKEDVQYIPMYWKRKYPYREIDDGTYKMFGHRLLEISTEKEGYRFNLEKRAFEKSNKAEAYFNSVTTSKPSAEIICLKKYGRTVQMALILQPRTPYIADIWDEEKGEYVQYARFFFEQPAGLLEIGETFEQGAKRETEEETGFEVQDIQLLIKPVICRHVSYSDESSQVFVAKLGREIGQKLDRNESIKPYWFPLEKVEEELENYLEGINNKFFGYDIPDMTILSLQRFFTKWNRGDFKDFI